MAASDWRSTRWLNDGRHPAQQQRCVVMHRAVDRDRIDDGQVHLAEEQVGEDECVGRSSPEQLLGSFASVPSRSAHRRSRPTRSRVTPSQASCRSYPRQNSSSTWPLPAVAGHRRDLVLAGEHGRSVLGVGHSPPQRCVEAAEVVAVEVALGPHLPVRRDLLAEPSGGRSAARPSGRGRTPSRCSSMPPDPRCSASVPAVPLWLANTNPRWVATWPGRSSEHSSLATARARRVGARPSGRRRCRRSTRGTCTGATRRCRSRPWSRLTPR